MTRTRRTHAEMEHAVWVASRGGVTDPHRIATRVRLGVATVQAIIRRFEEREALLDTLLALMRASEARQARQAIQARATTPRNHERGEER